MQIKNKILIATIITCHNRRDMTLECLNALYSATLPKNHIMDVFLVDDGCSDGTPSAVKKSFPKVNIIEGTGHLYWNQGMRLAWQSAAKKKDYDFYLWLNDDTYIKSGALTEVFDCYNLNLKNKINETIVVGACMNSQSNKKFSYGLAKDKIKLIPNGLIQNGNMINGNFVLISKNIFHTLGFLSDDFTHGMGDVDYGLRAIQLGFDVVTTRKFIGNCKLNKSLPLWCNPKIKFAKRLQAFHSPLGININEYKILLKRFWPNRYFTTLSKIYFRLLFPKIYNILKNG